ncbi:MAG: hypothetical protein K9J06_05945 [Flavobacteriales bacterium]|nr:hypothetical protein [Flavobacteriales bacterium]
MAQHSDALSRVNVLIGPENSVQVKGKLFIIDGFRSGKKVKTDKVSIYDLDPLSVAYDVENGIVSVSCFSEMGECVQRQLHADGQKNYRWRIAFDAKDAAVAEELMVVLREMLVRTQGK